MTHVPKNAHGAVARTLEIWHDMVSSKNLNSLRSIVHDEAVFRSPMAFTPYVSADALILALTTVIEVFEDFTYHRQLTSDDGLDVVLEFSARVGEKKLKGIDFIRFDENGLIREFEVMVRPMSGLQALGDEMGRRLGDLLPAFKGNN